MSDTSIQSSGTLLIIGQPPADLVDYCFSGLAKRTIVVEPDPGLAARVESRLAGVPNAQIIAAAPWLGRRQAEIKIFNFPGLRSLYAPNERLKRLLPGLKVQNQIVVDRITLKVLTARLGELWNPVHVVINLPGSEHQIVDFWRRTGFLDQIAQLDILCCAETFFHKGKNAREVQDIVVNNFFDLASSNEDDPDWPLLTFRANRFRRELAALRREFNQRKAEWAETKARLEKQVQEADAAKLQACEAETTIAELREALATRDAALVQANDKAEEQTAAATAARSLAEEAEEYGKEQFKALQRAEEDLSIALRMQSVLQADLSDMRQKFTESERHRLEQEELLSKLTPRLQQAAKQIRYLSMTSEDPEAVEAPGDGK